jgi:hypothetical protein
MKQNWKSSNKSVKIMIKTLTKLNEVKMMIGLDLSLLLSTWSCLHQSLLLTISKLFTWQLWWVYQHFWNHFACSYLSKVFFMKSLRVKQSLSLLSVATWGGMRRTWYSKKNHTECFRRLWVNHNFSSPLLGLH